jgi:hypothetical protein
MNGRVASVENVESDPQRTSGEFLAGFQVKPRWLGTTASAIVSTPSPTWKIPATSQKREEKNDQVDCCCWLCLSLRNFGGSNEARAHSSAGRLDHTSRCRLRPR